MKEQLAALYALQLIDTRVAGLEKALSALDDGSALEREAAVLEQRMAEAVRRAQKAETELRDNELALKQLEEKLTAEKKRLYSGAVRNPKELQGIQSEVNALQRSRGDRDERVLLAMDVRDSARVERIEAEQALVTARVRLETIRAEFAQRNAELAQQLQEARSQREGAIAGVSSLLLKAYEAIRPRGQNLAVVRVTENSCPGCHTSLPSLVLKRLSNPTEMITCESCGRILYRDDQ